MDGVSPCFCSRYLFLGSFAPFLELHEKHSGWMFSIVFVPPRAIGIMWSAVITSADEDLRRISPQARRHIGHRSYFATSAVHSARE